MYLDFEIDAPEVVLDRMKFVGKAGRFTPVAEGEGGGILYRVKDDKPYKVTGTSGYLWMESDTAKELNAKVDMNYFEHLVDNAIGALNKHGDAAWFCGKRL